MTADRWRLPLTREEKELRTRLYRACEDLTLRQSLHLAVMLIVSLTDKKTAKETAAERTKRAKNEHAELCCRLVEAGCCDLDTLLRTAALIVSGVIVGLDRAEGER